MLNQLPLTKSKTLSVTYIFHGNNSQYLIFYNSHLAGLTQSYALAVTIIFLFQETIHRGNNIIDFEIEMNTCELLI